MGVFWLTLGNDSTLLISAPEPNCKRSDVLRPVTDSASLDFFCVILFGIGWEVLRDIDSFVVFCCISCWSSIFASLPVPIE